MIDGGILTQKNMWKILKKGEKNLLGSSLLNLWGTFLKEMVTYKSLFCMLAPLIWMLLGSFESTLFKKIIFCLVIFL